MSTFTDWNGPHGSNVRASDLIELAGAYQRMLSELHEHIAATPSANDVHNIKEYIEPIIAEYTKLIRTFQSLSPGTQIYCNLIFPCTDAAVAEMPGRENRGAYNDAIARMCAENGWTCIDTTAGFNSSYFNSDGIHFGMNWYPIWWQNLRSNVGF